MLLVPLFLAPRDARQRVRYAIKTSALATVPLGSWSMAACAREARLDQFFGGERERVQRVGPGGRGIQDLAEYELVGWKGMEMRGDASGHVVPL